MNYFLVSQNKTYKEESSEGLLWAPKEDKNNRKPHHWLRMQEVRKGDIVFNNVKGTLVDVIIADEDCQSMRKPEAEMFKDWNSDGWGVRCSYHKLDKPLLYKDIIEDVLELQGEKYAPFNKKGAGNQGYLFHVTSELADLILERIIPENADVMQSLLDDDIQIITDLDPVLVDKKATKTSNNTAAEAYRTVKVRNLQRLFRKNLLKIKNCCELCQIDEVSLLTASHIKPWSKTENAEEKIDPKNGLLLCPNHDILFDKGLISFKNDGRIILGAGLSGKLADLFQIDATKRIDMCLEQEVYMAYHREYVFKES